MSLARAARCVTLGSFPRASGDEPAAVFIAQHLKWFSPRERG